MMNEDLAESSLMCEESAWEGRFARPVTDNRWSKRAFTTGIGFYNCKQSDELRFARGNFCFRVYFGHLEKRGMDENCWHHITGGDLAQ